MGAVILAVADVRQLTEAMGDLLLPGQRKVHWHSDRPRRHDTVIGQVAELPIRAVVVVRHGPRSDRQERRRRKAFERLVPALVERGCAELTLESRGPHADQKDRQMLDALRSRHQADGLRLTHTPGPADPLLWYADAVVGAVVASRTGRPRWRQWLADKITVMEIEDPEQSASPGPCRPTGSPEAHFRDHLNGAATPSV